MNPIQQASNAFLDLFEWAYEVKFTPEQRAAVGAQLRKGLSNEDQSDLELLDYVLKIHEMVAHTDPVQTNPFRAQARIAFAPYFSINENNDRSRIMSTIEQAIQEQGGGSQSTDNLPLPSFGQVNSVVAQPRQDPFVQETPNPRDYAAIKRKVEMEQLEIQMEQYIWEKKMETSKGIWSR
jgi:hypothetical protein